MLALRPIIVAALVLALVETFGFAQDPVINGITPAAVVPGAKTALQINGGNLAKAKRLWLNFPAEITLAEGIDKNGENPAQVTYQIGVPPETACGIYGMRVFTDKGVTPLRFLFVDDLPSIAAVGSNLQPNSAQSVSLPTAIDGVVGALNWQYFKFTVSAGQRLSCEVVARRIGSSLDPFLRILDAQGRELAYNDDTPGLSGDASILYTFKEGGEYLLELRDIKYGTGAYRLRIGDFPVATIAYPMAVQRGTATNVTLVGFGTEGLKPTTLAVPASYPYEWMNISLKRPNGFSAFSSVAVVSTPQFVEHEPNNTAEQANRIDLGHDINGRFELPGDVDRFSFAAMKDQSATFTGITRQQGSPTDLNFRILNSDGGQLAAAEDNGPNEGSLTYKFPSDGVYSVVVEDLNHRGGSEHAYRIAMTPSSPQFSLALSQDTFNVPAGGSITASVTSVRTGYNGPIELSALDLPEQVTASKSVIGVGRNDASITLQSVGEFNISEVPNFSIVGRARIGDADVVVPADIVGVLRARNNNMRWSPMQLNRSVAISSSAPYGFIWRVDPDSIVLGKDLSTTVKLRATRTEGFDEGIVVAISPTKESLPPGISVALKNIDKGQTEADLVVSANNQSPLGDFTIGFSGTLKQGDKTIVQGLSLRLNLLPTLTITLDPASGKIAKGGTLVVKATVQRNPALSGPVTVSLLNLPAGIAALPATIAADQTTAEMTLTAGADVSPVEINNLAAKAEAMAGNTKIEAKSADVKLSVE